MPTLIRGSDAQFTLTLTKDKQPLDLTACTAVIVSFIDQDGQASTRTLAANQVELLEPRGAGRIRITLANDFTSLLKIGERLDFQIQMTIAGKEVIQLVESKLTIKPTIGS